MAARTPFRRIVTGRARYVEVKQASGFDMSDARTAALQGVIGMDTRAHRKAGNVAPARRIGGHDVRVRQ